MQTRGMLRPHRPRHPVPTTPDTTQGGQLAVVTCHFNWAGFDRPRQNLHRFLRQMRSMGVQVYGIEAVLPGQKPQTLGNPKWRQIDANPETQILFQKEQLLNLAERLVPPQFTKIAWLDADIMFGNLNWARDTSLLLDRYYFVQPFETAAWTSHNGNEEFRKPSTLRMRGGLPTVSHPGFAMAARRSLWKDAGGLYRNLIVGNGDMGIAAAILRQEVPSTQKYSPELAAHYGPWHDRIAYLSERWGLTFTPGTIWHEWHGSIRDRRYAERNYLLSRVDPGTHLTVGANGLMEWTDAAPQECKDYVRDYFINRREDGIPQPPTTENDHDRNPTS